MDWVVQEQDLRCQPRYALHSGKNLPERTGAAHVGYQGSVQYLFSRRRTNRYYERVQARYIYTIQ